MICQTIWLILICYCVLMFPSVAGEKSTVKKCAIIGKGAQLFSIDNDYAEPSLYHETDTRIASWNGTTYTVADMDPRYSGKIYMDRKRNIWIFDVERKDAGKYYLKFGIQIVRHEILLIVMEELTEEQPQECPNNHPDFTKEGNLTGEQVRQIRKWLADHTEHIKEYLGNLIGEQIGQIRKLQDVHTEDIKKYLGNLIGEQIGQIRKLQDDHSEHMKEYLGNCNFSIIGLLIAILVILILDIILRNKTCIRDGRITKQHWIRETLCRDHRSIQLSQSLDECTGVTTEGSCETISKLPEPPKEIEALPPERNGTNIGETIPKPPKPSEETEALPPERNGTDIENEDEFHPLVPGRKEIRIRETDGNMKSRDSEYNDERNELLPKGACGSNFPIHESEDDFHQMGQERKTIHIRKTEG